MPAVDCAVQICQIMSVCGLRSHRLNNQRYPRVYGGESVSRRAQPAIMIWIDYDYRDQITNATYRLDDYQLFGCLYTIRSR
jgi:hypothetical protein